MPTTAVVLKLAQKLEDGSDGSTAEEQDCLQLLRSCNISLDDWKSSFARLSNEVHGYPWSGESVIVKTNELPSGLACVIRGMAEAMHLSVEEKVDA